MMRVHVRGALVWSLLAVAAPGQSAEPDKPTAKPGDELDVWLDTSIDAEQAEEITALIEQLGSPAYTERMDATTVLIGLGPKTFSMLRDALHRHEDLEVRLRIEEIVREVYLRHYVYDRNAFLGISQNLIPKEHGDDSRIAVHHIGIEVRRILKNTAAEAAELKQGDIIIAVDNEPLTGTGQEGVLAFGESIRIRGPGTSIHLTILRGRQQVEYDVALGARPKEYYNLPQGPIVDMLREARQGFERFWENHFVNAPSRSP